MLEIKNTTPQNNENNENQYTIAVYIDDEYRIPFLVHYIDTDENTASLGMEFYPDVEQDEEIDLSTLEILDTESDEYKDAVIHINKLI